MRRGHPAAKLTLDVEGFAKLPRLVISARARSGLTESRGIPKAARVRFNLLAFDWRPAGMKPSLFFLDLQERVVGAVAAGQTVPVGGQDVHGQRRQRCEVVATTARRWRSGCAGNGRPPAFTLWRARGIGFWQDRREAGSHAAGSAQGAGRSRLGGQLLCALAFSSP